MEGYDLRCWLSAPRHYGEVRTTGSASNGTIHIACQTRSTSSALQVPKGLNFLPTTRLLGVVKVDTGAEARIDDAARPEGIARSHLSIAITRPSSRIGLYRCATPAALDFYAMRRRRELTKKSLEAARAPPQTARAEVVAMQSQLRAVATVFHPGPL